MTTNAKVNIDVSGQGDLFAHLADNKRQDEPTLTKPVAGVRRFISPSPTKITIGNMLLEEHLHAAGQKLPFVLAQVLDEQDYSEFERRYDKAGRPPYAPRNMVGIILYSIMNGVSSLRGVENSARLNLGCMWASGGIMPDHASIGRFINMHAQTLTESFFEAIVRTALKKTQSNTKLLAGDGTVIEAACSHYKLYKEEALRQVAQEARQTLQQKPDDEDMQKKVERFDIALDEIDRRNTNRRINKRQISVTEPDAMLQKAKRGRGFMSSYKPSVLANEQRVIVANAVSPACEAGVIPQMLEQSMTIGGSEVEEILLDAGYFTAEVIQTTLEYDVSLLCPAKADPKRQKAPKYFLKDQFHYDESSDSYICPAGERLVHKDSWYTERSNKYGYAPCSNCPLKAQCTKCKGGRTIQRYPMDEEKDALREIMKHPKACDVYSKRQSMVEPVFSYLRQVQGLNRFRRRGLKGVQIEFGLHVLAYNISRIMFYSITKNTPN